MRASYFTQPASTPVATVSAAPAASATPESTPAETPAAQAAPASDQTVAPPTALADAAQAPAGDPTKSQAAVGGTPPVAGGMPKVSAFALPIEHLNGVAQGSGLQWVNSDPARIAAVQAAIAAEAPAVHVPRERPAPVQIDEGPLILVETKRDLAKLDLPVVE